MNKEFIIRIKDQDGHAVVRIDPNGHLKEFENHFKTLSEVQVKYVAGHCASQKLMQSMATSMGSMLKIEEVKRAITFEEFYDHYGYKIKRQRALKVWNGLSKTDQWSAYAYIHKYEAHLRKTSVAKMYPSSYLNEKPWND